jgi:plastocyanin
MRATPVRLILALLPLLAAGCSAADRRQDDGGAVPPPPTSIQVSEGVVVVQNLSFNPQRSEAQVGREVVWRFSDNGLAHTVTADDKSFDSGRMPSGEFRHLFDQPGEVAYHCEVHRSMKGTVAVSG